MSKESNGFLQGIKNYLTRKENKSKVSKIVRSADERQRKYDEAMKLLRKK